MGLHSFAKVETRLFTTKRTYRCDMPIRPYRIYSSFRNGSSIPMLIVQVKLPFSFDGMLVPHGDGSAETQSTVKALEALKLIISSWRQRKTSTSKAELEQLRAEITDKGSKPSGSNHFVYSESNYRSTETRLVLIDVMLREMGWDIDQVGCQEFEVQGMP